MKLFRVAGKGSSSGLLEAFGDIPAESCVKLNVLEVGFDGGFRGKSTSKLAIEWLEPTIDQEVASNVHRQLHSECNLELELGFDAR